MEILCDSTCDLSLSFIEENNLHLFPLRVILGTEEYKDLIDLKTEKIYESIKEGIHPKTSQVPIAEFLEYFTKMAEEKKSGIYIAISSKLSGTYSTACMACETVKKEFPGLDIRIIDSKTASVGIGVLLAEAVRMRDEKNSLDAVEKRIRFMADNLITLFTLSDLAYLAEGGRISKSASAIGTFLQVHPVMQMINGEVAITEKIRGKKRVNKRIIEIVKEMGDQLENQTVGVAYSSEPEERDQLVEALKNHFEIGDLLIRPIGAAIASHGGLGTLGIAFLKKYE